MNNNYMPHRETTVPSPPAGMPALDDTAGDISWFEFAPARLFYAPVALYCLWLSVKYRGLTLPTIANPGLPNAGLVGESKHAVLDQLQGTARKRLAPYVRIVRETGHDGPRRTVACASNRMAEHGLAYPVVAKPDIGMRGAGVQVIRTENDLHAYVATFPAGAGFLLQTLVDREGEAGIFYVRHPDEEKGRIISLTLKYFPRVIGDGHQTLRQLILADRRAGKLAHLYLDRHRNRLDSVIADGKSVRLAFAGNHCRGTIFRDGAPYVTKAMTEAFDKLAKSIEGFYVGRFDVRFGDFRQLQAGKGFRIIEVNGAGGESTHIWDSRMTLRGAYRALMKQFHHLYEIGCKNRKRGYRPAGVRAILKAWRHEKKLTRQYPSTH